MMDGVLDTDLKAENIFVTINEHKEIARCAVGDFDTAKKLNKDTVARTCIGTPSFIAPEVLTARERAGDYNFKADGMATLDPLHSQSQQADIINTKLTLSRARSLSLVSVFVWNDHLRMSDAQATVRRHPTIANLDEDRRRRATRAARAA